MASPNIPQRTLFTFQSNGIIDGRRMVEATAEPLVEHEAAAPLDPEATKLRWFGPEDTLAGIFAPLGISELDLEGVLSTLRVNKISNREVEVEAGALETAGFVAGQ